jgi:3-dehydroquinate dehydratase II
VKNRVDVMHGVNLNVLGRRAPEHYGSLTLIQLETRIAGFGRALGLNMTFFQTNHEGEFCESLHRAGERADALVLNPGAWTHYSYAIRDALEVAGIPAMEVHLSRLDDREEFRHSSVIRDLCVGSIAGKGVDGYREALEVLTGTLSP